MSGGGQGPGKWSSARPLPLRALLHTQPGRPYGKGTFRACWLVPGDWVKLDIIWLQRKWQEGPRTAPGVFVMLGDLTSEEKEN